MIDTKTSLRVTPDQIGLAVDQSELVTRCNSHNGFAFLAEYENKEGEVANHLILTGINYGKLKETSKAFLQSWADGVAPDLGLDKDGQPIESIKVSYHTYIGTVGEEKGVEHNRDKKNSGRVSTHQVREFPLLDDEVIAAVKVRIEQLSHERPAGYEKEGRGLYSLESTQSLYIRDALRCRKTVLKPGSYPVKHTTLPIALKDKVESFVGVGKYRQFILDGRFKSIHLGGVALLVNRIGFETWEIELFEAMPRYMKQFVSEQALPQPV